MNIKCGFELPGSHSEMGNKILGSITPYLEIKLNFSLMTLFISTLNLFSPFSPCITLTSCSLFFLQMFLTLLQSPLQSHSLSGPSLTRFCLQLGRCLLPSYLLLSFPMSASLASGPLALPRPTGSATVIPLR